MVQRKVEFNKNELDIQAHSLKTEKKQTIIKPSLQKHEGKSKGADLKVIKMKKSRPTKRSNVEISLNSSPEIHKPSLVTPINTPSPKKPAPYMSSSSPNYMKSTSSSEARKEKTTPTKLSNTKISSLKKMRTLIKAPSFKHTRSAGAYKKVVVQRATCSSTLKDSKFPTYLKLKPGATEAEGNSVFKVCPYNYCSLNGHHHVSAPPLKRFLSSRRRLMKTLKDKPEVSKEDIFIEVYVPHTEVESEDSVDHTGDSNVLSGIRFRLEDEDYGATPVRRQTSVDSEFFGENSDMEWEEGQSVATNFESCDIFVETDCSKEEEKAGYELDKSVSEYSEFVAADEYSPYCQDEIVECLHFTDTDSLPDSEFTETGEKHMEELVMVTDDMNISQPNNERAEDFHLADKATVHAGQLDKSNDFQARNLPDFPVEITLTVNEEPDSYQVETDDDESDIGNYTVREIREEDATEFMEESEPSEESKLPITDNLEAFITKEEICMVDNDDQAATDEVGSGKEDASYCNTDDGNFFLVKGGDNCVSKRSVNSEEKNELRKVKLHIDEHDIAEVKSGIHKTEESDAVSVIRNSMQDARNLSSNTGESDAKMELLDSCNKLKRLSRCRKAHEDVEEAREFNPRGPNFLTVELEPEAEKVDLRHQEMGERRNTEEWMLDYALQKTVNQLAPARKKKVALLVEAFESVLPIPKYENHIRRRSTGFARASPIQACS